MDNTYYKNNNNESYLIILEYDITFTTKDGKYTYLIGKKSKTNIVVIQKINNELNKTTENIHLDYAWDEIEKNLQTNNDTVKDKEVCKKAYIKYLLYHYNLGCTIHKNYKGYQKLVEFIKPIITDYI